MMEQKRMVEEDESERCGGKNRMKQNLTKVQILTS